MNLKNIKDKAVSCLGNRKIITAIVLVLCILAIAGSFLMKDEGNVDFRILKDEEIPQDIISGIIPEYRNLERALACCVGEKIYVLVTRGEKPTSGYEIRTKSMEAIKKDGKTNLIVCAEFKDPEPGSSLSQVLTYPLEVSETELKTLPDSIELRVKY